MSETKNTEPTQQELEEFRKKMNDFYSEEIPRLKLQKEYEILLADIEEARAKRLTMTMRIAQIMSPPPAEDESHSEQEPGESKPRTLKKEA